jgi:hypothetical protein
MRRSAVMFDFRERRSPRRMTVLLVFLLGAVAGAAGGKWFGERAADAKAHEAAWLARMELAAAVCADTFMAQDGAHAALANLVSLEWGKRPAVLVKRGWATMPDRARPDEAVARLCAVKLGEAYTDVRKTLPVIPASGTPATGS